MSCSDPCHPLLQGRPRAQEGLVQAEGSQQGGCSSLLPSCCDLTNVVISSRFHRHTSITFLTVSMNLPRLLPLLFPSDLLLVLHFLRRLKHRRGGSIHQFLCSHLLLVLFLLLLLLLGFAWLWLRERRQLLMDSLKLEDTETTGSLKLAGS